MLEMLEICFLECYNKSVEGRGHFYLPANSRYLWNVRAPRQGKWQTIGNGFLLGCNMKRCSRCNEVKDFSEFYKSKREKDGLNFWCKECMHVHRYGNTPRLYRASNPGKGYNPKYYKGYDPEHYRKHSQKRLEYNKKWQRENREHFLERNRQYQQSHRAEIKETTKKWQKANPEKLKQYWRNRAAREKGATGTVTAEELQKLKEKYNFTCLCCKRKEPEIELTHDHVKPLVIGGENTIENSQPLCRSCNSKKGKKWIDYR
jgi:Restriction endonuclease